MITALNNVTAIKITIEIIMYGYYSAEFTIGNNKTNITIEETCDGQELQTISNEAKEKVFYDILNELLKDQFDKDRYTDDNIYYIHEQNPRDGITWEICLTNDANEQISLQGSDLNSSVFENIKRITSKENTVKDSINTFIECTLE